jgi:hypothetical protein
VGFARNSVRFQPASAKTVRPKSKDRLSTPSIRSAKMRQPDSDSQWDLKSRSTCDDDPLCKWVSIPSNKNTVNVLLSPSELSFSRQVKTFRVSSMSFRSTAAVLGSRQLGRRSLNRCDESRLFFASMTWPKSSSKASSTRPLSRKRRLRKS